MNQEEPTHGPGVRILVAEDAPINRKVLEMLFAQRSLDAEFVGNGLEAVERIASGHSFDIIFLDIEMPGMNGHEAARKIRSLGCKAPIVAISGHFDNEQKVKSKEAGMNEYLTKPLDIPRIFSLIDACRQAASPVDSDSSDAHAVPPVPVLDLTYLRSLSRGNSAFEHQMLTIFMEDVPPQMQELRKALASANAREASDLSHKMKSSFRMLGMNKGADLLQQIEEETRAGQIPATVAEQTEAISDILQQSLAEIRAQLSIAF